MKIVNETHWRTDHLKAFVSRIAGYELNAAQRKPLVVTFRYTRGGRSSSGWASYYGDTCLVRLSKHYPDKVDLAFVIAHELAHTRGMRHRSMRGDPKYRRLPPKTAEIYGWAADMPLDVQPVKYPPRKNDSTKLEHAQAMLERNASKLKRLTAICQKWRTKVRYYERKLAAQRAAPAVDPQRHDES
jgi:hypothetical protein